MTTFAEKLKAARLAKSLKQSDVAEKLNCAPTSLTNWENGKVKPSLDVLSNLCDIYEISPLSLLDKKYSYQDIAEISEKPVSARSYEEQIALNFSFPVLSKLIGVEAQRQETARIQETEKFLRETGAIYRYGMLNRAQIDAIKAEYDNNGGADSDILFAFHALNDSSKKAFLSMLSGLLMQGDNVQVFADNTERAIAYTLDHLEQERKALNK